MFSAIRSITISERGKFEEVSDRMGVENYWPWGPSVGDLNADGWDDIFIASSMNFPYRYGINSLLLNNRGQKFLDCRVSFWASSRAGADERTHPGSSSIAPSSRPMPRSS